MGISYFSEIFDKIETFKKQNPKHSLVIGLLFVWGFSLLIQCPYKLLVYIDLLFLCDTVLAAFVFLVTSHLI
jgi:CRISPR/Cas system-associated protein Csx1